MTKIRIEVKETLLQYSIVKLLKVEINGLTQSIKEYSNLNTFHSIEQRAFDKYVQPLLDNDIKVDYEAVYKRL